MKLFKIVLPFIFVLGLLSCKDEPVTAEENNTVSTFYFIRHAEKERSNPENSDPELSQAGLGRAMHWAEILEDVAIDAVYSTGYERTQMTAAPIAVKKNLTVQFYDFESLNVEQFKTDNLNKKVLVVGHSNTTPEFVNKLIGSVKYAQIDDHQNGNLYIVEVVNDIATDMLLNFNCNCPE